MKTPDISIGISENALAALHASTAQIRKLFLPNCDLASILVCAKIKKNYKGVLSMPFGNACFIKPDAEFVWEFAG